MSTINETHPTPVRHASVGHQPVKLLGRHSGPVPLQDGESRGTRKVRRRQAKAAVAARRQEVARGADFLRTLTTTRYGKGGGPSS